MLLALASTVNAIPLPPISDRHGVRLPAAQHCLTNVNFSIVPNPLPADFDDFEQAPPPLDPACPTSNGSGGGGVSQSTLADTQASTGSNLFDSNPARPARDKDDYDNDDADMPADDASVTTLHPSQSQTHLAPDTADPSSQSHTQSLPNTDSSRGVKRSLDEDDEYD